MLLLARDARELEDAVDLHLAALHLLRELDGARELRGRGAAELLRRTEGEAEVALPQAHRRLEVPDELAGAAHDPLLRDAAERRGEGGHARREDRELERALADLAPGRVHPVEPVRLAEHVDDLAAAVLGRVLEAERNRRADDGALHGGIPFSC